MANWRSVKQAAVRKGRAEAVHSVKKALGDVSGASLAAATKALESNLYAARESMNTALTLDESLLLKIAEEELAHANGEEDDVLTDKQEARQRAWERCLKARLATAALEDGTE
eukprot:1666941-Prymnesium_polylepis.1